MSNSTVCVDAGLVIRLYTARDNNAYRQLWDEWDRDRMRIVAPALLFYEVTNVFYRYQRLGILGEGTVDAALQATLALPVQLVGDLELHRAAKQAAQEYGLVNTYDAHYLALAKHFNATLWTTDARLFHSLSRLDIHWMRLVSP